MKNSEQRETVIKNIESKYPQFEELWNNIVENLGDSFITNVRSIFGNELNNIFKYGQFDISVVIDNNFIFGQIKNIVSKKSRLEDSFVYKLVESSCVKVYAPYKLKEELFDKIESIIVSGKSIATQYASQLLSKISVQDAYWIDEWKKANNLIGDIDQDDVPYLALCFDKETHGILSKDKIFKSQCDSQVWNIGDTEKIISCYKSGFLSFSLIHGGTFALNKVHDFLIVIFRQILELISDVFRCLAGLLKEGVTYISKLPDYIKCILIGFGLVFISSPEYRKKGVDVINKIREALTPVMQNLRAFLINFVSFIETLKSSFNNFNNILEFLSIEYQRLIKKMESLEAQRARL